MFTSLKLASDDVFKRKIFYECINWIDNKKNRNILFLIGPRRCGKTVCLMQLKRYKGLDYFNFKNNCADVNNEYIEDIIQNKTDGIFYWMRLLILRVIQITLVSFLQVLTRIYLVVL